MDSVDAYLAQLIDLTIVVYEMQLAAPLEMLSTIGLVEFNLQWKRQYLAILELEHSLNLGAIFVLVHLESARWPIEHVDELIAEMRIGRRTIASREVAHHLVLLLTIQRRRLGQLNQPRRGLRLLLIDRGPIEAACSPGMIEASLMAAGGML